MYEFERVEILDQLLEKILSMRGFDGFRKIQEILKTIIKWKQSWTYFQ